MLTKVCRARIKYLKLSCFLHYPLTVEAIFCIAIFCVVKEGR